MIGSIFKGPIAIVLLIFVFLIVACASKPNIIGKWREVGKTATVEFLADGSLKVVDNQGMAVAGEYTLSKDEVLRCKIQQEGSSEEVIDLRILINGDELTLTGSEGGEVERYRRDK